jgi:hypothetical protein
MPQGLPGTRGREDFRRAFLILLRSCMCASAERTASGRPRTVAAVGAPYVLIAGTDLVNPELTGDARGRLADPDGSVTVEIRRTYRIPRFRVAQAIFDTTDHFVLTDGTVLVTVQFRRSSEQGLNVR